MTARSGRGRRYPMPCPGCRKIIDARDHLCPHCGIDTDAKLAPFRAILPIVAVALLSGLWWAAGALPRAWTVGLGVGLAAGLAAAWLRRRR